MALDVPPTPLRRRERRLPVIAVLAGGIAVVALALATAETDHRGTPRPAFPRRASRPVARSDARDRHAPPPRRAVAGDGRRRLRPLARRLPRDVACHQLSRAACDVVARASLAALPADGPVVTAIEAWRSILCGDTFDCPPDRLARSVPLGSAVVSFGGQAPRAWVNVVAPSPASDGAPSVAPVAGSCADSVDAAWARGVRSRLARGRDGDRVVAGP